MKNKLNLDIETCALLNADCKAVLALIPDNSIDLIVIDPPYIFNQGGYGGAFGKDKRNYHDELNDIKDGFDLTTLDDMARVLKKMNMYIFCNKELLTKLIAKYEPTKYLLDVLVWHKTNPIPTCNNKYLSDLEYILFIKEKGVKVAGSYKTKTKLFQSPINKTDKDKYKHPTVKPVPLLERLITNSSQKGDMIADFFMGSGSTGEAAANLQRRFLGCEIRSDYYEIAKQRLKGEKKP